MQFPARFADLPEYAFPRLRTLLAGTPPGGPELAMTIGEPKHPVPAFVAGIVAAHAAEFGRYPPNEGAAELLAAIAAWIGRRYGVTVDPETQVIALNGSREGLFSAALALSPEAKGGARPAVLVPNPFYQAYGAGALAAGAELVPVPATAETGFLPDYAALPPALLDRVTLAYLCSPSNPQGAVADAGYLRGCSPSPSATTSASSPTSATARFTPTRRRPARSPPSRPRPAPTPSGCWSSTRSPSARTRPACAPASLPAGRGRSRRCASSAPTAARRCRCRSSARRPRSGSDEEHVAASRARYGAKFAIADRMLAGFPGYRAPEGGFFLWLRVGDGEAAALRLWRETGVRVLPGGYLGRATAAGAEPGRGLHPRGAGGRRRRGRARSRGDPRHVRGVDLQGEGLTRWRHAPRPSGAHR